MSESDEEFDSEKSIPLEASEACREIGPFVKLAELSTKLALDDNNVKYFNVCTHENKQYCIEVSEQGFRVVAPHYDTIDAPVRATSRLYETSHSLLQTLSESYKHQFAAALSQRLTELADSKQSDDESALDADDAKDKTELPVPLSARFVNSFAYRTIKDRIPVTLTRTVDSLCRRKQQFADPIRNEQLKALIGCLSQFKQELQTNKPLSNFEITFDRVAHPREARLIEAWNAALANYSKRHGAHSLRYFEAPWLLVECYAYERVNVHRMNIGLEVDVFEPEKHDAFEKLRPSIELLVISFSQALAELGSGRSAKLREHLSLFMRAALWANHADLSLFDVRSVSGLLETNEGQGKTDHDGQALATWATCFQQREAKVLVDDSSSVIDYLLAHILVQSGSSAKPPRVAFVLDNAGFELVADLCLAALLLSACDALKLSLYVKTQPWFVSDAMQTDLEWTLERLAASERDVVRDFAHLVRKHLETGRLLVEEHHFWHLPAAYSEMQRVEPKLYAELAAFDLLLFKGDLNYRKLVGDRDWPVETTFRCALHGFEPTRLCVLRTLKADVCVGLSTSQKTSLDTTDPEWMVNGEYGVIQFLDTTI